VSSLTFTVGYSTIFAAVPRGNLLASGVPQTVAMKITDHKTDSMFRRYAFVTVEQQREALRAARAYRELQATAQRGKLATITQHSKGIQ